MSSLVPRYTVIVGGPATVAALTLVAYSKSGKGEVRGTKVDGDIATVTTGATPKPHVKTPKWVRGNLTKGSGIRSNIKEINGYQIPNSSLKDGSLAANFYWTPNFLVQQNKEKGYDFVSIADVHIRSMGIHTSKGYKDVEETKEGGIIVLNSNPANTARGLKPPAQAGPVELDEFAELPSDTGVTFNPRKLKFTTVDDAQAYKSMPDARTVVINNSYAIDAGLNPKKDAFVLEKGDKNSECPNRLVVRKDDKDNEYLKKLAKFLSNEKPRDYIDGTWPDGAVTAVL